MSKDEQKHLWVGKEVTCFGSFLFLLVERAFEVVHRMEVSGQVTRLRPPPRKQCCQAVVRRKFVGSLTLSELVGQSKL